MRAIVIVPVVLASLVAIVGAVFVADEYVFRGSLFEDSDDTPNEGPCLPSNFQLEKIAFSTKDGWSQVKGNVVSHCAQASGVELRWTATRDDGTVAFSHTFWPDSVSNIPANSSYPVDYSVAAPSGHFTSKIEPFKTKAW